jgi:CheY-like chemotaxis protein
MAGNNWRLLVVDDDPEICERILDGLNGEIVLEPNGQLQVDTLSDFSEALNALEERRFDLLILDVRLRTPDNTELDETAGIQTLEAIQQKRFLPIVFYTAAPHLVNPLVSPLIRVVEKTEQIPGLLGAIREVFSTRLPVVNRALIQHIENVQCNYMWNFVAGNWEQLGQTPDHGGLAYLLARRLAKSLSGSGLRELVEGLGYSPEGIVTSENTIHPMEYYIMPPVNKDPLAGDIYFGKVGGQEGYWICLTPSCDLVPRKIKGSNEMKPKAEYLLLARCFLLEKQEEYKNWRNDQSNSNKRRALESLMRNRREKSQPERFYFLPGVLNLPDLVVDFQRLISMQYEDACDGRIHRSASLDSPFSESLLAQFSKFFGRLGTPDLDIEAVIGRFPFTMPELNQEE